MSGDTARSMSVRARINNLAKELDIAYAHVVESIKNLIDAAT